MQASSVSADLTGGCQCGAVRYRLAAAACSADICHCRMCQKAGGGPFMAFANGPAQAFVVTRGAIAAFASSDIAKRGFCAACGTPLTYRGHGTGRISVTLGSLDDPQAFAPQSQMGVESQVAWLAHVLQTPATNTDVWNAEKNIADAGSRQHPDHET